MVGALDAQNNRVLTTQMVIPIRDGTTQRDAFGLKKVIDEWLRATPEAQIQGQTLRCVTEAPPSMEARRRAGGRAYGVVGAVVKRAQEARPVLREAKVLFQWGTPLEVFVRGIAGRDRARCVATWQSGEWKTRDEAVHDVFGEEVSPSELLGALRG